MITRWYFISAQKPWNDGSGSYSFEYIHLSVRSWLPNQSNVFVKARDAITTAMKDKPGEKIMITAFNRC